MLRDRNFRVVLFLRHKNVTEHLVLYLTELNAKENLVLSRCYAKENLVGVTLKTLGKLDVSNAKENSVGVTLKKM